MTTTRMCVLEVEGEIKVEFRQADMSITIVALFAFKGQAHIAEFTGKLEPFHLLRLAPLCAASVPYPPSF